MEEDVEGVVSEQKEDDEAVLHDVAVFKTVGEEVEGEEEDEDEDFDFDPLLQNMDDKEATSSLSSEENEEGLDEEGKDQLEGVLDEENDASWLELGSDMEDDEFIGNYEDDDEDVDEDENMEDNNEAVLGNLAGQNQNVCETMLDGGETEKSELDAGSNALNSCNASGQDEDADNLTDKAEADLLGQTMNALPELNCPRKSVIVRQSGESNDKDFEDAIWKRTRARFSLADMSLDKLETFLQESDEEDFFQNVDDEEEYRKFVAGVAGSLEGYNGGDQVAQNKEDDDDDEDNDADFEIEIEEAMESDDDIIDRKNRKRKHRENFRRPTTRESRRQRSSIQSKDRLLGLANRPLRPLLPLTEQIQSRSLEGKNTISDQFSHDLIPIESTNLITGFTAHQLGQLHCLIHEHVQLLVQVFSLCVLEPSKQQIALEAQRMLIELADKRDEVLSQKTNSFPDFCFHPPYIHPSVLENIQCHAKPMHSDISNGTVSNSAGDSVHYDAQSGWVPSISGPVLSVLDVAPVGLVREFLNDVDLVVQECRHKIGEYHIQDEREPLFPLHGTDPGSQSQQKMRGAVSCGIHVVSSTYPQQKKTMAAVLVENTKRQSVALVSKNIVKVAQRFYPLFNSALFPHKPPPASTANRVLFTDAEDELLAMGLWIYNTNWKAIKERFLPCKSVHQIFVRQKNRASSRAPENSIKAMRKMKTSPLTAEEKACIHEGLRVLKFDWRKVWEYCVPYRDPTLLPRQWRIALGTQKSYKTNDATKEKRRLYEARRRRSKALQKEGCVDFGTEGRQAQQFENDDCEENSGDDNAEDTEQPYVHEAFLADWKPHNSRFVAALPLTSSVLAMNRSNPSINNIGAHSEAGWKERTSSVQSHNFSQPPSEARSVQQTTAYQVSQIPYVSGAPSAMTSSLQSASHAFARRPVRTQVNLRPYRSRNKHRVQTVKLAPDLPTLNLPPSVRVIPQSMLMGSHYSGSQRIPFSQTKTSNTQSCTSILKPDSSSVATSTILSSSVVGLERNLSTERSMHSHHNNEREVASTQQKSFSIPNQEPRESHQIQEMLPTEEPMTTLGNHETIETDIGMHPLLLQNSSEDSFHYQNKYGTSTQIPFSTLRGNVRNSDCRSFFMPYQRNGVLNNQIAYPPASVTKGTVVSSNSADFHPLLQRNTEFNEASTTIITNSNMQKSCDSGRNEILSIQVSPSSGISRPLARQTKTQEKNRLQQSEHGISSPPNNVIEMHSEKHVDAENGIKEPEIAQGSNGRTLKRNVVSRKQTTSRVSKQSVSNSKRRTKNRANSNVQGCLSFSNNSDTYFHGVQNVIKSSQEVYMGMGHMLSSDDIAASRQSNKDKQGANALCLKDDSLPGIIMEQEELSDSEDGIGESVQFEYEEMVDSDGDYTTTLEQQSNMLDKEEQSIEFEKEEIVSEGEETEDDCRIENTLSSRTADASQYTLSASDVATINTRQNFVKNRSKKLQCWDAPTDSMDIKSKMKRRSFKRVGKQHGETTQTFGRRRRIEKSQEKSNIHSRDHVAANTQEFNLNVAQFPREHLPSPSPLKCPQKGKNVKCPVQMGLRSIDASLNGCSSAIEAEVIPKKHANDSGVHCEIATERSESHVFDKEDSTSQCVRDKTAIAAAQVLTGIHQSTADESSRPQVS